MHDVKPSDENTNKPKGKDIEKVFQKARERFDGIVGNPNEIDLREQGNEDLKFANERGGQWDDQYAQDWRGGPKYEVNQIQPRINVVVGSQRESDLTSKVIPLGGGATKKTADIMNGLVRSSNVLSNFDDARDNAFREACTVGIGGWYITTEWNEADPWVQDIVSKPIRSAINTIFWDPNSTGEVNEDANYCFVCEWISEEVFKELYPDAPMTDMPADSGPETWSRWFSEGKVRIADYWVKEPVTKTIGLFQRPKTDAMGRVIGVEEQTWDIDKKTKQILDEAAGEGWEIKRDRDIESHRVVHYKMCGSCILEGPNEWAGKYIPVVPVYGYQTWLDGVRRYWGMVRLAKDPQRLYNYCLSSAINAAAKSPKDPYWISRKQMENVADARAIQNMAINDNPFYFYTTDPENPGPPKRTGAPAFPQAMVAMMGEAAQNIERTTGRFESSQGDNPMNQSGRAVIALQRQGDLGTYVLVDNLAKAIRRHTEILVDLIPRIYDTERQLRITESDGNTKLIQTFVDSSNVEKFTVNEEFKDEQTGESVLVVDLNQGRYDVQESIGASYSSKRQEAFDALTQMSQSNPQVAMLIMDEVIKMMDFNGTEEAIKRVQKFMVQNGLREPTEEEIIEAQKRAQSMPQQRPSPQEQIAMEQAKMQMEAQALENDRREIDNNIKKLEMQKMQLDMQLKTQQAQQDTISSAAKIEETLAKADKVEAETAQIQRDAISQQ